MFPEENLCLSSNTPRMYWRSIVGRCTERGSQGALTAHHLRMRISRAKFAAITGPDDTHRLGLEMKLSAATAEKESFNE
jgi:hypothetical protein